MQPRDGRVPLFVFPTSLTFYLEDRSSHKQVLTLYNPYEFPVRFQVLCTKPKNYSVVESEGSLKAECRTDIVVRHIAATAANCGVTDKFRIQMTDYTTKEVIGKKDVTATLVSEKQKEQSSNERIQNLPSTTHLSLHKEPISQRHYQDQTQNIGIAVILISIICFVILLLPIEENRLIPQLQISCNIKIFCGFCLGIIFMIVLKPC